MEPKPGPIRIVYRFDLAEGRVAHEVRLDPDDLSIIDPEPAEAPGWTALETNKCDHCPLSSRSSPRCPAAVRLAAVAESFRDAASTTIARCEVETAERTYVKTGPLQHALQSLFGLVLSGSGCPHLTFLRPLARFHLPFATLEETIYRAVGTHLLEQYVRARRGDPESFELGRLVDRYDAVSKVNRGLMARLKVLGSKDGGRNALVILDAFGKMMRMECQDDLPLLAPLFPEERYSVLVAAAGRRR